MSMQLFIDCPYEEKDEAKKLGAKWDGVKKRWYASDEETFGKLEKWHNKRTGPREKPYQKPIGQTAPKRLCPSRTKADDCARNSYGSYYKGVWGGVPSVGQYRLMKAGSSVMSTAYDTRGD